MNFESEVRWDDNGLVPAIAQDFRSRDVLTLAWMNLDSFRATLEERRAVYWSRSRKTLWKKGEISGHIQKLVEMRLDCDGDCILLLVDQVGGIACHTGRHRCFFRKAAEKSWVETDPVLKDPETIYPTDI
jgi:phosphoribosyl-AMP cyclohydrolase